MSQTVHFAPTQDQPVDLFRNSPDDVEHRVLYHDDEQHDDDDNSHSLVDLDDDQLDHVFKLDDLGPADLDFVLDRCRAREPELLVHR